MVAPAASRHSKFATQLGPNFKTYAAGFDLLHVGKAKTTPSRIATPKSINALAMVIGFSVIR
jgi:hypothetical protein